MGSGGGLDRLKQGALDIAVTDWPLTPGELQQIGAAQVPLFADGLTVAVNLPGASQLKLTGDNLADTFTNANTSWARGDLTAANPGVPLAGITSKPVCRSDASGSTRVFTSYLSRANRNWSRRVGSGFTVDWPSHVQAVAGTSGVVQTIRGAVGSIGYLGMAEARGASLLMPSLTNSGGNYLAPTIAGVQAALATAEWDKRNNQADIERNAAPGAWPLTVVVYAVFRTAGFGEDAKKFLRSAIADGGADIGQRGFVALPAAPRALAQSTLASLQLNASAA